jgi:gliding motility-associated-like protein
MRKFILLSFVLFVSINVFSQDFSNKGKDFWLCFPNHIPSGAGTGQMTIWITSDQASSGVVSMTNGALSVPFTVTPNLMTPINIPHALAHISNAESGMVIQKSIRIKVDPGQPGVVAYAQQYGNARSAATLLLPTNVLGKKHYAIAFNQLTTSGGGQNAMSQFQVIATQPNTNVTVTPRFNGTIQPAFNISLPNIGDMYQYQASQDITGTLIESIAGGTGTCLPIAVFSGSSATSFGILGCTGGQTSYDPLFQQLYPVSSWGKNFGFIPFGDYPNGNPYRVMASEDNTNIYFNGALVTTLNAGQIYPATYNTTPVVFNQPTYISADRPITVAHYSQRRDCSGSNNGDPDMVILNPVEQNIKDITVFASTQQNIDRQWINVLIQTVAVPSFRIDGAIPTTAFLPVVNMPGYSYLTHRFIPATSGSHRITADSGFNAICYGFQQGQFESYAYSAGTNVKDLTQALELGTQYGDGSSNSVCIGSPFKIKIYFPDSTLATPPVAIRFDSLRWDLSNKAIIVPNNFPILQINPTIDSTNTRNGRVVNWYSLPGFYFFNTVGVDTLILTTYKTTNEGCGNELTYEFPIEITGPPVADFTWTPGGCVAEPYKFNETTPQTPKPTYNFYWNFGDPASGPNNISYLRNPSHTFSQPGMSYNVQYAAITTSGCLTDTVTKMVFVDSLPNGIISATPTTVCINTLPQPAVTFTGRLGTLPYTFIYSINGIPQPPLLSNAAGIGIINAPVNVSGTFVYKLDSIKNTGSTLCVQEVIGQSVTITITPDATMGLSPTSPGTASQTVCVNTPILDIVYDLGGSANGASPDVTSVFPPGVTGSYNAATKKYTITGTPSAAGVYVYKINSEGPCVNVFVTGTITVTDDGAISLLSPVGSDNQTVCVNTPLPLNIVYQAAGSTTNVTVAGLPPGVTGTYNAATKQLTILGTPNPVITVATAYPYTITTFGPCVNPTASGTITVDPDATITLAPGSGAADQTVCVNNAIANIVYDLAGSATNAVPDVTSVFPPGVTGTYNAATKKYTIAGTPTLAGIYVYRINSVGPCVTPFVTGTITVTGDGTIVLSPASPGTANQSVCANTALTQIIFQAGGTTTNATIAGLPPGVNGVYNAATKEFTITGTPNPVITVTTTYPYTITTFGPCVNPTASGVITVYALPTPNFSFTIPSCQTRTINFTDLSVANSGTVNSWLWDFGDGSPTVTIQNPTHVYALAGTYNVTLSVVTAPPLGCTSAAPANIPVTINARPLAGFIIPEVCLSDTYAQFFDTSKVALPGMINTWEWNFGDPFATPPGNPNTSTQQNPTHSYTAVGNYNVQLIATSTLGCKDTITQVLVVNGSFPVANFTVQNPTTLCANDSVAVVNQSTVFPGSITKVEIWFDNAVSGPPGLPDISDDFPFTGKVYKHLYPNFQAPLTRTFQIRFRAYSGIVCQDDSISTITVNAAPKIQFNNMPDTCFLAAPFQITQATEIGGVPGTGVFSGPGVTPGGIFSPAVAGIGLHTIKYTFTSTAAGCVDTMSKTIRVLDTAHAFFTNTTPICEGVGASFTDASTAPPTVTLDYTVWDFGDGTPPVVNQFPGSTITHVFANPGTYIVRMYNVTTVGCNSTVFAKSVTVDPNHSITLTTANSIQTRCINNAIVDIKYNLGGGATGATVTGLPPGVTYAIAGTVLTITGAPNTTVGSPFNYNIQTTGNTCTVANATGRITVEPDHTITIEPGSVKDQSVCVNTAITPIVYILGGGANNVTVTGLPAGVNYVVAGNTVTISGSPSTTLPTPLFNYSIVTTGNTCLVANASGTIKVNPYPVPMFAVDKPSYCIPNAIVKFNNSSTVADGTAMTYIWNFGDGSPLNSGVSPSNWYSSQGPFNVNLSVRSGAVLTPSGIGCVHDTTIVVNNIHPQPKADFSINKPSICIKDDVTFTDLSDGKDGTINQWNWDLGDGSIRNTNTVTYTYTDTITFNVKLYTINTPHGCNSDTITKQFTVYPYPHVNAGPDRNILEGGQITLESVTFANDPQYLWTPNLYLVNNKVARPVVNKPLTDMTYTLTVTARGGCTLSDDVFVKLLKFPVIPNTFTPNNDGKNDTWRIDYLNTYPNNRVQIFTRTGQLVFESRGYNTPWDGTLKGKPLPFDTYYYIIEPGNGRDPITGYVTIIK